MENRLSIIYSTREIDPAYEYQLKRTCGLPLSCLDVIPIRNNGEMSLSETYNKGLASAKHNIVVFCHDDLIFNTINWGRKLGKHFSRNPDYGILGVAGTNHLVSGMWWEDRASMHGIVNHSENGKTWTSKFSADQGNKVSPMIVLDGVFFAIDKTKIIHTFDTEFEGFHFYDLGFTFANFLAGVKIGVFTDIRLTHMSVGHTNEKWEENKTKFETKYKGNIPCII